MEMETKYSTPGEKLAALHHQAGLVVSHEAPAVEAPAVEAPAALATAEPDVAIDNAIAVEGSTAHDAHDAPVAHDAVVPTPIEPVDPSEEHS